MLAALFKYYAVFLAFGLGFQLLPIRPGPLLKNVCVCSDFFGAVLFLVWGIFSFSFITAFQILFKNIDLIMVMVTWALQSGGSNQLFTLGS